MVAWMLVVGVGTALACDDPSRCLAACDAGDRKSCESIVVGVGDALAPVQLVAGDPGGERVAQPGRFQGEEGCLDLAACVVACELDELGACAREAALWQSLAPLDADTMAAPWLARACALEHAPSCSELALDRLEGRAGVPRGELALIDAGERCELGDAEACLVKVRIASSAKEAKKGWRKVVKTAQEPCEQGDAAACEALALGWATLGKTPRADEAVAAWTAAAGQDCRRGGDLASCRSVYTTWLDGGLPGRVEGDPLIPAPDPEAGIRFGDDAVALLTARCSAGEVDACGEALSFGASMLGRCPDGKEESCVAAAARGLEAVCSAEVEAACGGFVGLDGPSDSRVQKCRDGSPADCAKIWLEAPHHESAGLAAALRCRVGDTDACFIATALGGVPGHQGLEAACAKGHAPSCGWLDAVEGKAVERRASSCGDGPACEAACSSGEAGACADAATWWRELGPVDGLRLRAAVPGCEAGGVNSCALVAQERLPGGRLATDLHAYATLTLPGCERGDQRQCRALDDALPVRARDDLRDEQRRLATAILAGCGPDSLRPCEVAEARFAALNNSEGASEARLTRVSSQPLACAQSSLEDCTRVVTLAAAEGVGLVVDVDDPELPEEEQQLVAEVIGDPSRDELRGFLDVAVDALGCDVDDNAVACWQLVRLAVDAGRACRAGQGLSAPCFEVIEPVLVEVCEAGVADACELADDPKRARASRARCMGGDGDACHEAGVSEILAPEAFAALMTACATQASGPSCWAASLHEDLESPASSDALKRGCDAEHEASCAVLRPVSSEPASDR